MKSRPPHPGTPALQRSLEHRQRLDLLAEILATLPTQQLLLIVMHYFHHIRLEDLALARGVHYSTVKRLHAAALETLRKRCADRGFQLKDLL